MNSKLLFETMDITEADLAKWTLDEEGISYLITGRSTVTEFQAVPIQIFVSTDVYEKAYALCDRKGLFKSKTRKKREYTKQEKQWLCYLASFIPIIFTILLIEIPQKISIGLATLYFLFGKYLYARYRESLKEN